MAQAPKDEAESAGAILDAAETLFAVQGFASTTVKQIGAAAGMNPGVWFSTRQRRFP